MYILLNRIFYVIFANTILLTLLKKKINKLKKQPNFKELIFKEKASSIFSLFLSIITILLFLLCFLIWYRIRNGTF